MIRWLLAASALVAVAQPASAQSLTEALVSTYNTNPQLNSARAQARATDEGVPQAMSNYRPSVSGTVQIQGQASYSAGFYGSSQGSQAQGYAVPLTMGLQLTQPLFRGYQTTNSVRQAESNVLAQREQLRDTEQTVLQNAVSAFMNVIQQQALVQLQKSNLDFLTQQVKVNEERFKVGEGTTTDVAQAQASAAQAQANVNAAQANLMSAQATFRQVTGLDAKNLKQQPLGAKLRPRTLDVALTAAQQKHPAIQAAAYNADVAAFNVKVIEGGTLPTVNLQAGVQQGYNWAYGNQDSSGQRSQTSATAGVTMNMPFYTGGLVSSQVRQAKEQLGYAQIQIDLYRDQVRQNVVAAWGNLQAAEASIRAAKSSVSANQLALNGVVDEQKVGQATTLDVLQQQSDLVQAQTTLVQATYQQAVALYQLIAATGRLDAVSLALPVRVYDPVSHYKQVRDKWYGLTTPDGR